MVKRIPLPAGAYAIAYDPQNGLIYATGLDGNLTVANTTSLSVVATKHLGNGCQQTLAYDPASDSMYIGDGDCNGGVVAINPTNLSVVARLQGILGAGLDAYAVLYDPFSNVMVLPSVGSGNISFVNATTNVMLGVTTLASTQAFVTGVALNPDTKEIYIAPGGLMDGTGVGVINASSLTYLREIPLGTSPATLGYANWTKTLFAIGSGDQLSLIDGRTDVTRVADVPLRTSYFGAAYDSTTGLVYTATNNPLNDCKSPGFVTLINPAPTASVIGRVQVGDGPQQVAVDSTNGQVFVTDLCSNSVAIINAATHAVRNLSIPVGSGPEGIVSDPTNGLVYVSDVYDNSLWTINASTLTSNRLLTLPNYSQPSALAYDAKDGRIFVAEYGSANVSVLNSSSNMLLSTTIPVGSNPQALAYDSVNGLLYVACSASNNVTVVNGSTLAVVGSVPTDVGPVALSLDTNASTLFVANLNSGTINFVNTSGNSRFAGFTQVLTAPQGMAFVPGDNQLEVFDESSGVVSILANAPSIASLSSTPNPSEVGIPTSIRALVINGTPPYSYSIGNLPLGCALATPFGLNCTFTVAGSYRVFFNASDSAGYLAWGIVLLNVTSGFGSASLVGRPASLDIGQTLILSLLVLGGVAPFLIRYSGLPSGCVTMNNRSLTCRPTAAGLYETAAQVVDAAGSQTTAVAQVTVNVLPSILAITSSPTPATAGRPVALSVYAAGGTGSLSYVYLGLPVGCITSNASVLSCSPAKAGSYVVSVELTDSTNATSSASYQLLVNPALSLAVSLHVFPRSISLGQSIELSAIVTNSSGTVSYSYDMLPSGCISLSTPTIECVPGSVGNYSIMVVVIDGLGNASGGAALQIGPAPPVTLSHPTSSTDLPLVLGVGLAAGLAGSCIGWFLARRRLLRPP
ncbi:MAG: YncE family protein [Thermoplasmata archaeon]|nr:YncE family protein [Thermoplasmata archaeon]